MKFTIKADAVISAENIDAAMLKIAEHFRKIVVEEEYDEIIIETGSLMVHPGYTEGCTPRETQDAGDS